MALIHERLTHYWSDLKRRLASTATPALSPAVVFSQFRRVLNTNNQAMEIIADLGEKLSGDYIFDKHYLETALERLGGTVKESILALIELCNGRHDELLPVHHRLTGELELLLSGHEDRNGRPILPLDQVHFLDWEVIGGKGARLAEMRRDSLLQVPDGFVISTRSYHDLIDHNGLRPQLDRFEHLLSNRETDPPAIEKLRKLLEEAIQKAVPPPLLLDAIETALSSMSAQATTPVFLAVRSSAQEEDMDFSFAGQFRSVLNVPAGVDTVFSAYRQVAASLFSSEAVSYCRQVFPTEGLMSIAAVCQQMVAASASGVAFSVDTMAPAQDTMVIVGAWGQGDAVVEGHIPTDTFVISKTEPPVILERHVVGKLQGRFQSPTGGVVTERIPAALWNQPCLSDAELLHLGRQLMHLEFTYKRPQDVEWTLDQAGTLHILQSRTLLVAEAAYRNQALPEALNRYELILAEHGRVAQQGIGAGPVRIVNGPTDLEDFPMGAVLVSRLDSSHFVKVMNRTAAIVTEIGTPASHMATLCREMRVPCLVNTGAILSKVREGEIITVDAEDRLIYRGRVKELLRYKASSPVQLGSSREFRLLRRLLKRVSTLHLIDPLLQDFSVEGCRTYHDILRFIHETAVMQMVSLGRDERKLLRGNYARRLDLPVPAGIVAIDIGGGLAPDAPRDQVPFTAVDSIPFRAILQGMLFPGVWHRTQMPVGMRDLMTSMLSAPPDAINGRYSGHNIAIISREYVNLCFRLGYHFNIIDAHCSETERDNHIYFRFLGGATDLAKRTRRAMMIAAILEAFDFHIRVKGDMVIARAGNMVQHEMERTLDILGRLVGFTRQLDVRLDSDALVDQYVEAFLYGNYDIVNSGPLS